MWNMIVPRRFFNPLARRSEPDHEKATEQAKAHTRALLQLPEDVVISVNELVCREHGCPDVETIVAVMRAGQKTRKVSIRKRIADVTIADLAAVFGCANPVNTASGSSPKKHC
jgi:hypothetical protein